jgi:hypothetical protein
MEINGELLEHALDGLSLLEPDAEGELGPLGAEGHAAGPDIRPSDPILQIIIHSGCRIRIQSGRWIRIHFWS